MARISPVDPTKLTADQKRVYDSIASGPRGGVRGPFLALLHVPDLADRIQNVGEYLRYNTSYPPRMSEMAIIITARAHRCNYEWYAHAKIALKAGLPPEVVEAIRQDREPALTDAKEKLVYQFVRELTRDHRVSDTTYGAVNETFGLRGAVELAGLVGYYAMIAMTLNAHEVALPEGEPAPF
jgi:4-carboxymuconolactone decarboxylase